jgi:hypothetical protein
MGQAVQIAVIKDILDRVSAKSTTLGEREQGKRLSRSGQVRARERDDSAPAVDRCGGDQYPSIRPVASSSWTAPGKDGCLSGARTIHHP